MTAKERNQEALKLLMQQNWEDAQKLFFENARKYPSHETFNNLGYYLVSEGLLCKDGNFRNSHKLGLEYLIKASKMKTSHINLCALAVAIEYELSSATKSQAKKLYEKSRLYLDKALQINYSDEIQYNLLRVLSLICPTNAEVLNKTRNLVRNFICEESVSLYFELLRVNSLYDEGMKCIERYKNFLSNVDLLMFFSKFELYDKGYEICEAVYKEFAIDKYIASAIIECCLNSKNFDKAIFYAQAIKDADDDIQYDKKENWCKDVFDDINSSSQFRKELIRQYIAIPSFITPCCYYGCTEHGTIWD